MNARSKSAVDPARALIGWFCRSKGNKARLEHLRILGGAALVDRCVDDGWIEVRRARSGEILRCACPCGADLEAVRAAEPLADFHDDWNWGFITTDRMVQTLYNDAVGNDVSYE